MAVAGSGRQMGILNCEIHHMSLLSNEEKEKTPRAHVCQLICVCVFVCVFVCLCVCLLRGTWLRATGTKAGSGQETERRGFPDYNIITDNLQR